jgi:uncharacterized protein (TIGR03086 family)
VSGNLLFARACPGERLPGRDTDHLSGEPLPAFQRAAAELRQAFAVPGLLESVYTASFGTGPVAVLVHVRIIELLAHGWDLARDTGQPAAFPDNVAERALAAARQQLSSRPEGPGAPSPLQFLADDAPAVDRLAGLAQALTFPHQSLLRQRGDRPCLLGRSRHHSAQRPHRTKASLCAWSLRLPTVLRLCRQQPLVTPWRTRRRAGVGWFRRFGAMMESIPAAPVPGAARSAMKWWRRGVSIGETLAQAREQAGLTITQVSQQTRIRQSIIADIERGDFGSCGGDFYARGDIRAIARAVGADPGPLIEEYDAMRGASGPVTAADVFGPVRPVRLHERRAVPWAAVLGLRYWPQSAWRPTILSPACTIRTPCRRRRPGPAPFSGGSSYS